MQQLYDTEPYNSCEKVMLTLAGGSVGWRRYPKFEFPTKSNRTSPAGYGQADWYMFCRCCHEAPLGTDETKSHWGVHFAAICYLA